MRNEQVGSDLEKTLSRERNYQVRKESESNDEVLREPEN